MKFSRRDFLAMAAAVSASGCARVEQTKLGKLTPEFDFGDDGMLKIALIGDLQILDSRGVGIVGRAVNLINNDKNIDFTVVLGNLTTHGTLPEMNLTRQALDRLNQPYFCIPGERDFNPATENPYEFYQRTFKKTQWRNNSAGWVLIGFDTNDGTNENATASAENLAWLDNQLSHTDKKKPIALFTHHALSPNGNAPRLTNADEVLARFEGYNLKLAASGHYRGNQEEEHNGVLFTSSVCLSATASNDDGTTEKGFRVFTMEGQAIQHEFIAVT